MHFSSAFAAGDAEKSVPREDIGYSGGSSLLWVALWLLTRLRNLAAIYDALIQGCWQIFGNGRSESEVLGVAKQLGLKAKISCTNTGRRSMLPPPSVTHLVDCSGSSGSVLLVSCEGQRVLSQARSPDRRARPARNARTRRRFEDLCNPHGYESSGRGKPY